MKRDEFRRLRLPSSGYLEANGPFYAKWDGQQFVLGLRIEDRHCNAAGDCQGGMLATLCDVLLTVGANIQSSQSRFLPTISLSCDFIAPATKGEWIEGRVEILRTTRNLMFASGLLEIPDKGPIVRTSAVLKVSQTPDPRFDSRCYFD